ncbi:MAG: TIGR02680 family protein [Erysipelotrichaceae bacterium]|nr:TIGR02680 family protein [Erysipelotrichaceae bacterium]
MNISQWHMHRLGLVDFWYYDNDEFYFKDGHMLLRGSNGSGKSVTMQSIVPLLLDGNRSPERIDAFGSRSRTLDTYLIDENTDRDERIGYLYLEFKREDSELYKTIGMGIHAKRNRKLTIWYFVIEDNKRINVDFSLMNNHLTLSRKQLENILGNQVIDGQREYMKRVNDALFGFPTVEEYKDAIDLLLQVRSPKLSDSLKPSTISEILANSLQPLSEEDLRPMSEAITDMDNLQDELENLKTSLVAAKKIVTAYDNYNKAMLIDKYQKYQKQNDIYKNIEKDIKDKQEVINNLKNQYETMLLDQKQKEIRQEVLNKERSVLIDPNIERLFNDLTNLNNQIDNQSNQLKTKQTQHDHKSEQSIDIQKDINRYQNSFDAASRSAQISFKALEEIYADFPFSEHSALKIAFENAKPFRFDQTKKQLKIETIEVNHLLNKYNQYENKIAIIHTIDESIQKYQEQLNTLQQHLETSQKNYEICHTAYQEYFYQLNKEFETLQINDEQLKQMTRLLTDYEINRNYHPIYQMIRSQYNKQYSELDHTKTIKELELQSLDDNYVQVKQEYEDVFNNKDIEPERDEYILKLRHTLDDENIVYKPLYQLLDFDENINDDQKNRIEELLNQMKILDAIVVSTTHYDKIKQMSNIGHDYFLWTNKNVSHLTPISITYPFNDDQLKNMFKQLGINDNCDITIDDTYFKSGVVEGKIEGTMPFNFIGFQRRQALRKQRLEELQIKMDTLQQNIKDTQNNIDMIKNQLISLDNDLNNFKDDKELKNCLDIIDTYQKEITSISQLIDEQYEHKNKENEKARAIYDDIKSISTKLMIDLSKEAAQNRLQDISDYETYLDQLKDALQQQSHTQELLISYQDKMTNLIDDIDELKSEIDDLKKSLEVNTEHKKVITKQLEDSGYKDKQQKLESINKELKTIDDSLKRISNELVKNQTTQTFNQQTLNQSLVELENQKKIKDHYYENLLQEVNYEFFTNEENMKKDLRTLNSQNKSNRHVTDYFTSLQNVFFEQAAYLSEYHLMHEIDELTYNVDDLSGHFIIKANHQGKRIPFHQLIQILNDNIESQQLLVQKKDREIFEEILLNTIGKKIRTHIQSSKRWVEKMDHYMRSMRTSSGLEISLKWRPQKAMDEDEMDTYKLVQLLEKDYRLLKDSDRQKLSQHFRFKINQARRLSLDDNTTASFHSLVRDVMDYRQWFQFTLYGEKPDEKKKEITKNVFEKYSGGEKAMVMYVPLFSAVAARFENARDDAPRLIALDEAFARVDENNIGNMFELITKFDFDYVMNSQSLWGDYETCPSLAIYELYRPSGQKFISHIAYEWDGQARKVKY